MKTIILISLLILIAFCNFSQTQINGIITDENKETLIGATVSIINTYDGTSTDVNGKFSFSTNEIGKQTLEVKFIGYESQFKTITLNKEILNLNFTLKEKFNELKAVTITAGSFEASDKKKAVILSSLDMITTPGASGDVTGALQTLPGTTTVGESGKLFVRGGDSRETKTFIDGSLVHSPYSKSPPNLSVRGRYNPFMFEGTTFSTGGYSAEYGQALSSVLLLNTKGLPEDEEINLSILSVGLELGGAKKWKDGAITATLNHTNLGPYMTLTPQNQDWEKYPFFNTGAISIRQKTKKNGMFKFYSNFGNSKMELNREDIENENKLTSYSLNNTNYYTNASWKGIISDKWMLHSGISFTNEQDKIEIDSSNFKQTAIGGHLKNVLTYFINEKIKIKLGGDLFINDYSQNFSTNSSNNSAQYRDNMYAGFTETNIFLSSKFVVRVGGRIEYGDYLKKTTVSPRVSSAYKLNENSQLSVAYGDFYQNPNEQYLIYSKNLKSEKSSQYIVSYQTKKKDRTLRVEGFYKGYKNLVKFNNLPFFNSENYTNNGTGFSYGAELFLRDKKTIKNGDYWVSYSFLESKRDYKNYPELSTPSFASKHNLSIVYRQWVPKWRSLIGVSFNYSSPRFYNNPNEEKFNNAKMKAYQALNINWSFLYKEHIIFHAAVNNVLGYKQSFGHQYSSQLNSQGNYTSKEIVPGAKRFFILGCFITFSKNKEKNQLDKIN